MCPLCPTICILATWGGHPVRAENLGHGLGRLCGRGQGLPWAGGGVGSITFFPTHCLKCLPLRSATSWAANTVPVPEEPCRAALFRRKYHQRIKNVSTRRGLDLHPHQGLRTKEGPRPSRGKGPGCLVSFPSVTPGPGGKVLGE